jgi:2-polyprenyl-3-methyl-5-hydroxy-6-metoxy-1,4-benzoquinol methylase
MIWGNTMDVKCDFIDRNFLHLCQDRTVLEVGCFEGWITERVLTHNPKQLILLESHKKSVDFVTDKFPEATIIHGDMHENEDLKQVGPVDVALVLGVIYHSHAPLYALEKIVNICCPQTVILDNMNPYFVWREEPANEQGMRNTADSWRTCNIVLNIDNEITVKAMENLGYSLIKQEAYPEGAQGYTRPIFHFEKHE